MDTTTKEPQYKICLEEYQAQNSVKMGYMSSFVYRHDPKRLSFLLSRYKFVAKMFAGLNRVLEIGCGDAFGSVLVKKEVKSLVCSDFDIEFVKQARELHQDIEFVTLDFTKERYTQICDGVFALDVLEHISKADEDIFMKNILLSINRENGVAIIGMPSIESQYYASKESKEGHVNCKNGDELKYFLKNYFSNIFVFSMNDEVVHTGFYPMSHYLLALCTNPRSAI